MVYTVTLNPALDYIMQVGSLKTDDINRSYFEDLHYGGKGINVSVMLTRLGIRNKALGFVAGFTGDRLEELLRREGIDCCFLHLKEGNTRINVKIKSDTELDINARGPEVGEADIEKLIEYMSDIKEGDYLVLAGSVSENLPADTYGRILTALDNKGINFVVDATGDLLLDTLKYKPFLIKPNDNELADLFGVKIKDGSEIAEYALKLKEKGARNVLVSRGDKGAVLFDEGGNILSVGTARGNVVNTVGSGDSMVAGFLAGYINTGDYKYALRLGAACGNATAFCKDLAQNSEVKAVLKKLETH